MLLPLPSITLLLCLTFSFSIYFNFAPDTSIAYFLGDANSSNNNNEDDPFLDSLQHPRYLLDSESRIDIIDEENFQSATIESFEMIIFNDQNNSTINPTSPPTLSPTELPDTGNPTPNPTLQPTPSPSSLSPSLTPTIMPTSGPISSPTNPTNTQKPTSPPTNAPITLSPTNIPTTSTPSKNPTRKPTSPPTFAPITLAPSKDPTRNPTSKPTKAPMTMNPTKSPITASPTNVPTTANPTASPTTRAPSITPTRKPAGNPTKKPTTSGPTSIVPTKAPTTKSPTERPTTAFPTTPTPSPTNNPTKNPTNPTLAGQPTFSPSLHPLSPTRHPTGFPTPQPTEFPTSNPTLKPTASPTVNPCPKGCYYQSGSLACTELNLKLDPASVGTVCSATFQPDSPKTCLRNGKPSTFSDAVQTCAIFGMRLCSVAELEEGIGAPSFQKICTNDRESMSPTASPTEQPGEISGRNSNSHGKDGYNDSGDDESNEDQDQPSIGLGMLKKNIRNAAGGSKILFWTSTPCDTRRGYRIARPLGAGVSEDDYHCALETMDNQGKKNPIRVLCCADRTVNSSIHDRPCLKCKTGYTTPGSTYKNPAIGEQSCKTPPIPNVKTDAPTPSPFTKRLPNILLILMDDASAEVTYGETIIKANLPNINSLMTQGITFTKVFAQQANCGPSRASLLTGMRPDWTGVTDFLTGLRDRHGKSIITLPQYFKQLGYTSVTAIGKIFDGRNTGGKDKQDFPLSWSKKPFSVVNDASYVTSPIKVGNCGYGDSLNSQNPMNQCLTFQPTPQAANMYPDGRYATEAEKRLDPRRAILKTPWFLAIGFSRPHLPWVAPQIYWQKYERNSFQQMVDLDRQDPIGSKYDYAYDQNSELTGFAGFPGASEKASLNPPNDVRRAIYHGYFSAMSYVDAQIGRVIAALNKRSKDEIENTMIILTTDHGFSLGNKSIFGKHNVYELATRVPMIFIPPYTTSNHGTDEFSGVRGLKSNAPIEMIDLYPTIMDIVGIDNPKEYSLFDGVSFLAVLKDPLNHSGFKLAAISQHQSLVQTGVTSYSIRTYRYRYVIHISGDAASGAVIGRELYDYLTDPREVINRIGDNNYQIAQSQFEKIIKNTRSLRWTGINSSTGPFDAP